MTLGMLASWSAIAAIVALVISAVTLALFFGGAGDFWGPINDVFAAAALLLLIPLMLAVARLAPDDIGPWFGVVTALAIAGAVVGAAGQLLLVARVIDLQTSFLTGGVGILPVLVWALALAILVFGRDLLPIEIGWIMVGLFVAIAAASVSSALGPAWLTTGVTALLVLLLAAWLATMSAAVRHAM